MEIVSWWNMIPIYVRGNMYVHVGAAHNALHFGGNEVELASSS